MYVSKTNSKQLSNYETKSSDGSKIQSKIFNVLNSGWKIWSMKQTKDVMTCSTK